MLYLENAFRSWFRVKSLCTQSYTRIPVVLYLENEFRSGYIVVSLSLSPSASSGAEVWNSGGAEGSITLNFSRKLRST